MGSELYAAFSSGLTVPILSMDHISCILMVGMMAFTRGRSAQESLFYLATTLVAGGGQALLSLNGEGAFLIALSLPLLLVLLWFRAYVRRWTLPLIASVGLLQGYAYGSKFEVSSSAEHVAVYLLGILLIQSALLFGFGGLCGILSKKSPQSFESVENIMSAIAAGTALAFLVFAFR